MQHVLLIHGARGEHGKGSRNVHSTAIRRALSPSHPCDRVTAGVHG